MIRNTGLVLEGGGMRGVFTSGVLDAFMKTVSISSISWLYRQEHAMACRMLAISLVVHDCRILICL